MDPQDSGTPTPEAAPLQDAPQIDENQQIDGEQTDLQDAPQLSDEDYRLNFLGTDKFELDRQTPEEIRAALKNLEKSLNKGWTEKNMRLAEERKAVAAQQEESQRSAQVQQATIKELARLEALQDEISQYDNVDWPRWSREDPQAALTATMTLQNLQRQHAKLNDDVKSKQDQERQRQAQQAQAWLQKAEEKLRENVRDWSPEKGTTLQKFISETYLNTNTPMDQGALQAVAWHPGLVQMANEAMLYRESLKRAVSPKEQPTPAVPVSKVRGAAPAGGKDPTKMTDEEWLNWRNQDLANKRKAAPMNSIRRR
jgi:DNA-binding phage protein